MLEFKTENQFKSYIRHSRNRITIEQGELAHIEETNKIYVFNEDWKEIKTEGDSNIKLSLYEINEQLIKQLPDLTEEQIQEKKQIIIDFYTQKDTNVYMLLCKEHSYFTVFLLEDKWSLKNYESLENEVINCVLFNGAHTIRSIENIDNNELEIWAADKDNEIWCYHLFDYADGFIVCRR